MFAQGPVRPLSTGVVGPPIDIRGGGSSIPRTGSGLLAPEFRPWPSAFASPAPGGRAGLMVGVATVALGPSSDGASAAPVPLGAPAHGPPPLAIHSVSH